MLKKKKKNHDIVQNVFEVFQIVKYLQYPPPTTCIVKTLKMPGKISTHHKAKHLVLHSVPISLLSHTHLKKRLRPFCLFRLSWVMPAAVWLCKVLYCWAISSFKVSSSVSPWAVVQQSKHAAYALLSFYSRSDCQLKAAVLMLNRSYVINKLAEYRESEQKMCFLNALLYM